MPTVVVDGTNGIWNKSEGVIFNARTIDIYRQIRLYSINISDISSGRVVNIGLGGWTSVHAVSGGQSDSLKTWLEICLLRAKLFF